MHIDTFKEFEDALEEISNDFNNLLQTIYDVKNDFDRLTGRLQDLTYYDLEDLRGEEDDKS